MLADQQVQAGGYLRVHVHPKRFPAAHQVDWASRVVAVAQEFVVVNKPPGVQVGGALAGEAGVSQPAPAVLQRARPASARGR